MWSPDIGQINGAYSVARRGLSVAVTALHGLLLAAVLSVPFVAVGRAVSAVLRPGGAERLVDLERWAMLLGNTAVVCGVAVGVGLSVGGLAGFLAARTDMPGRRLLPMAGLLGICLPLYVWAILVFAVLPTWAYQGSATACGLIYGLIWTPLCTLVLWAVFRTGNPSLEDVAELDTTRAGVFRHVTLVEARWGLVVTGVLVCLLTATDVTIADILLVPTFARETYAQFALNRSAAGPVLAGIPLVVALSAALTLLAWRYGGMGERAASQVATRPRPFRLGSWRWLVTAACAGLLLPVIAWPFGKLLGHISSVAGFGAALRGVGSELLTSSGTSTVAASLIVLFAAGLAQHAVRGQWSRRIVWGTIVVVLATPTPVIGISLIALLNRPGWLGALYDSPGVIVCGYVARFLPIGILLLLPAIQRIPRELEDAARADGCDWLGVQRHVTWSAIRRDASVVWLLCAALCFGEVGTTMLVAPPGWSTASVRAFTLIHFGVYEDLAVLAFAVVGLILVPWALILVVSRRMVHRRHAFP